jgi:hypothetical protein
VSKLDTPAIPPTAVGGLFILSLPRHQRISCSPGASTLAPPRGREAARELMPRPCTKREEASPFVVGRVRTIHPLPWVGLQEDLVLTQSRSWWCVHTQPTRQTGRVPNPANGFGGAFTLRLKVVGSPSQSGWLPHRRSVMNDPPTALVGCVQEGSNG